MHSSIPSIFESRCERRIGLACLGFVLFLTLFLTLFFAFLHSVFCFFCGEVAIPSKGCSGHGCHLLLVFVSLFLLLFCFRILMLLLRSVYLRPRQIVLRAWDALARDLKRFRPHFFRSSCAFCFPSTSFLILVFFLRH